MRFFGSRSVTSAKPESMLEKLPGAVGHALREQRAGVDKLVVHRLDLRGGQGALTLQSLAFVDHGPMPARYTADGAGVSPPLQWSGVPSQARSLLLIVEDADAPTPQPLVHAIVVGLDARDTALAEGALSEAAGQVGGPRLGRHSFLGRGWLPPDPPPGHGPHAYAFQLFALDEGADFSDVPGRDEVVEALRSHALCSGWLIGTYERPDGSWKVPVAEGLAPIGIAPSNG